MTDNYVQVPPNSFGLKIDTSEVTSASGNVVERQRIVIADPLSPTQFADVTTAGALSVDLSTTIGVNLAEISDLLRRHGALLEAILLQLGGMPPTDRSN